MWGTDKSSGTFSTLFESRLIRAKRYLAAPFEVDFEQTLFGEGTGSRKILASRPIDIQFAESWDQFAAKEQAIMILNSDSASLPLPDASVDAVVTDPPYFDFVHYSELSDFFFAWLSPVLKNRYTWFNRPDSSDPREVQHKDPRIFARQLGSVFSECCRILKDDGVLVFSFHHSRAEGWAAIYEAVTTAGLAVVAAYPVHAELRAASPKSSAKNPISLDAVLVCRKQHSASPCLDEKAAIAKAEQLAKDLEFAGMSISSADRFVILSSQILTALSGRTENFEFVCRTLQRAAGQIISAHH